MIEEAKRLLKGKVDSYEMYYTYGSELSLEADLGSIRHVASGDTSGIGIRVLVGNRLGAAQASNIKELKQCVKNAIEIAKASKPDKNYNFASPGEYTKRQKPKAAVLNVDVDKAASFMDRVNKAVKSVSRKINVSSGMFSKDYNTVRLVNSEGLDVEDEAALLSYSAELVYKDKHMSDSTSFTLAERFPFKAMGAKEHAERLLSLVNRGDVKTQTCQVLLKPRALASFLDECYGFSVSARNIREGKSVIKKGQKVFDKAVNIVDDASTKGLFCTSRFDDEGTASKSFDVIKNGVFKQPLYDLYSARKDNVKSTGNCHRMSLSSTAILPNNVIFMPGNKDDLVGEIDEGIIVNEVLGQHMIDSATGNFSLGVLEGYYVKKGEIKHAVKDAMIAGNFFKMLGKVDGIGNKQRHVVAGSGGMYLPEVLCNQIRVIGQG
ncbi:MAG: TldD/PmbA family protein [Candidatus Woesearchaeota archaeon]